MNKRDHARDVMLGLILVGALMITATLACVWAVYAVWGG